MPCQVRIAMWSVIVGAVLLLPGCERGQKDPEKNGVGPKETVPVPGRLSESKPAENLSLRQALIGKWVAAEAGDGKKVAKVAAEHEFTTEEVTGVDYTVPLQSGTGALRITVVKVSYKVLREEASRVWIRTLWKPSPGAWGEIRRDGKRVDVLTQEAEITFIDQDSISIAWTDSGVKTVERLKRESPEKPGKKTQRAWALSDPVVSRRHNNREISTHFSERIPDRVESVEFVPGKGRKFVVVSFGLKALVADPKAVEASPGLNEAQKRGLAEKCRMLKLWELAVIDPSGKPHPEPWPIGWLEKGKYTIVINRGGKANTYLGLKDIPSPWHATSLSYTAIDNLAPYGLFSGLLEINRDVHLSILVSIPESAALDQLMLQVEKDPAVKMRVKK